MPSSKNYKRDYEQEYATAKARGENKDNAQRHRARYEMEKKGLVHRGDGKDVGHIKHIKGGGTNAPSNLEVQSVAKNRSFARNPDGSMKSETSKKEKGK
jgi:hypothetical protein